MNKKHLFIAITFFIVGLLYGAIFNFILQGETASIPFSCLQGLFVGILASVFYFMLILFFGYCFNEEYINDKLSKFCIISENIVYIGLIMYSVTMLITYNNRTPITLNYAWMHIVNLLFSILIVAKGNYAGKVLRKKKEKIHFNYWL